jgi:hypothetical protein
MFYTEDVAGLGRYATTEFSFNQFPVNYVADTVSADAIETLFVVASSLEAAIKAVSYLFGLVAFQGGLYLVFVDGLLGVDFGFQILERIGDEVPDVAQLVASPFPDHEEQNDDEGRQDDEGQDQAVPFLVVAQFQHFAGSVYCFVDVSHDVLLF